MFWCKYRGSCEIAKPGRQKEKRGHAMKTSYRECGKEYGTVLDKKQ